MINSAVGIVLLEKWFDCRSTVSKLHIQIFSLPLSYKTRTIVHTLSVYMEEWKLVSISFLGSSFVFLAILLILSLVDTVLFMDHVL